MVAVAVMEQRCATCRFWAHPEPEYEFGDITLGRCAAVPMRSTLKEDAIAAAGVDSDDWDAGEAALREALKLQKALVRDASAYFAALDTTPDFGCVLHEAPDGAA